MSAAKAERVEVRPKRPGRPGVHELEADAARLRRFAEFMDGEFEVGGYRFGYDALIGLVPGVGDVVTGAAALYPIYLARKHRLGNVVIGRMLGNWATDVVVGSVPAVGDAFDFAFKANRRNRDLFEKAVEKRRQREVV